MSKPQQRVAPELVAALTTLLLVPLFIIAQPLESILGVRGVNLYAAPLVFVQGLAVLRVMWRLEKRDGRGTVPFATCFFAVQHMAFGFGGVLVSVFDQDYFYANEQGTYVWSEAVLPLLLVHMVAMTVGLLGVWAATSPGREVWRASSRGGWRRPTVLSWDECELICYVAIGLHFITWVVLPRAHITGPVAYILTAMAGPLNGMFVLWALLWKQCTSKWVFLTYASAFAVLEMIEGNRSYFMFPVLMFGIGLFLSGAAKDVRKAWNVRRAFKMAPMAVLLLWGFVKSEDVRNAFSRGTPTDASEAIDRLESLGSNNADLKIAEDGTGKDMNGPFRVGARLFELSAADVCFANSRRGTFLGMEFGGLVGDFYGYASARAESRRDVFQQ